MVSWQLTKMLKVSTFSFHAGTEIDFWDPNFFHHFWLGGGSYRDFFRNVFPKLLQDMNLHSRLNLWFMHDDAPPHFLLAVREFFEQRLQRGGPTSWPGFSSDFNPLHFHLRGHLPSIVCTTAVSEAQNMYQRTQNGFEMILVALVIIHRVRRTLFTRTTSGV
jgi:hypothetical protein